MALICLIFVIAAINGLFSLFLAATPGDEDTGITLFIVSCIFMLAAIVANGLMGVN